MKIPVSKWWLCAAILACQPVFADSGGDMAASAMNAQQNHIGFTLDDVITKALQQSPLLQAFNRNIAAARGERWQAGVWANPNIGIEAENISGNGAYRRADSAEITYSIMQEFQIGGKIAARENIADKGIEIASLEEQAAALDIIRDITIAYADTVAAEENARLAEEQKTLAEDVLQSVSIRVNAAAAPLIQKSRAEVERSTAVIALDKAEREGQIARQQMAALMGEDAFALPLNADAFYTLSKPELAEHEARLHTNPDMVRLDSNLQQSKARLELEKANAIPDPQLSVGVRNLRETGDHAFVVGVSLPIPVFNANRGNIEKARNELSRTNFHNQQFSFNLHARLVQAQERMENAYLQAQTLQKEILPSADTAFRLAREGYDLGRFPYLEVLDAQRSLFAVRQQQINAIREFHIAKAHVERLTATYLQNILANTSAPEHLRQGGESHGE